MASSSKKEGATIPLDETLLSELTAPARSSRCKMGRCLDAMSAEAREAVVEARKLGVSPEKIRSVLSKRGTPDLPGPSAARVHFTGGCSCE